MKVRLSDIPFSQLECTENWLTSANGNSGHIYSISHHRDGKHFSTWLTLRFMQPDGNQTVTVAKYPDDCDKIEVDMPDEGTLLHPYANYQIYRLEREIEFFKHRRTKK